MSSGGSDRLILTRVTRKGQIMLPAAIRRATGIRRGDSLVVTTDGELISLVPLRLLDKHQAYFWSAAWQRAELEAGADNAQGRVRRFENAERPIEALEANQGLPGLPN